MSNEDLFTRAPEPPADDRIVISVSELNRQVREMLEGGFPLLWVEGELSNLARPSSGHLYFSLKDDRAQVRCAMFRNRNRLLPFRPADGRQVVVRARVSLYEPRGSYQLIVEHMEEAGHGALQRAFEELKEKLSREGLFETARKRELPALPRRIGVVTSPGGAAIRDILTVLGRRFPAAEVIVYPTPVQGGEAVPGLVDALARAGRRHETDVLIVGRGGGSLEDLWAFNEERVARAIHDCPIPVVSAVGHEVDVTIADFVADRRAPTPSGAAELVVPDQSDWLEGLVSGRQRLARAFTEWLQRRRTRLDNLAHRLAMRHPGQRLAEQNQRLDELETRLTHAVRTRIRSRRERLDVLTAHLWRHTPSHRLVRLDARLADIRRRLGRQAAGLVEQRRQRLTAAARALHAVSPLATLERGYAIVTRESDRRILRHAADTAVGERIHARLHHGKLVARVEDAITDEPSEES